MKPYPYNIQVLIISFFKKQLKKYKKLRIKLSKTLLKAIPSGQITSYMYTLIHLIKMGISNLYVTVKKYTKY